MVSDKEKATKTETNKQENIEIFPIRPYPMESNLDIRKDLSRKIQNSVKSLLSFAGYVLYFYDTDNLNCKLIPLPKIAPILRIKSYSQIFKLGKASISLEGKPLYLCFAGIPFSVDMKLDKDKSILIDKGYTPEEIDAKISSIYTERIFRKPRITINSVLLIILFILCSCLLTFMFTQMYYQGIIESMK